MIRMTDMIIKAEAGVSSKSKSKWYFDILDAPTDMVRKGQIFFSIQIVSKNKFKIFRIKKIFHYRIV